MILKEWEPRLTNLPDGPFKNELRSHINKLPNVESRVRRALRICQWYHAVAWVELLLVLSLAVYGLLLVFWLSGLKTTHVKLEVNPQDAKILFLSGGHADIEDPAKISPGLTFVPFAKIPDAHVRIEHPSTGIRRDVALQFHWGDFVTKKIDLQVAVPASSVSPTDFR